MQFEYHQSTVTTWVLFKTEFLKRFATCMRKVCTEPLLRTRTQHHNTGVAAFAEIMKTLFWRADKERADDERVRFSISGVRQDLFAVLVRHASKTIA